MQCASDDLEPGQSQPIEFLNTVPGEGKLPKYTSVTAEADF
ncbi:hypothetical protein ACWGID_25040 [Kribbella sp. NPDC054772]